MPCSVADLPECVLEFERRHERVQLSLKEVTIEEVMASVERGDADVGLNVDVWPVPRNPRLIFEPCYEVDVILVTPKDHPLARRRHVRPSDLRGFPLVNGPQGIRYQGLMAKFDELGVFKTQPRRVEAFYTASIRRYVQLGFGIGLIIGIPGRKPQSGLHERSMSRYFGRLPIYLIWRRRAGPSDPAAAFAETVRRMMKLKAANAIKKRRRRVVRACETFASVNFHDSSA